MRLPLTISIIFMVASSLPGANLLKDPGMERGQGGWDCPPYWSGKLQRVVDPAKAHSGKGALLLTSSTKDGKVFGRMYQNPAQEFPAGRKYRLSAWAKGRGNLYPGAFLGNQGTGKNFSYTFLYAKLPLRLSDQWQEVAAELDISGKAPNTLTPIFELQGKGEAYIDDISLELIENPATPVTAVGKHAVLPSDGTLPSLPFKTVPATEVQTSVLIPGAPASVKSTRSDTLGNVLSQEVKLSLPNVGTGRIFASLNGNQELIYADIIPPENWRRFDETAKKISLKKSLRILWLGDSLTDFDQGHNHVDKTAFWLEKYNPGKTSFRNAAVRGDFITRVEGRLKGMNGGKGEFQQSRYKDLFKQEYDLIFLFLGHNDTVASTKDNYGSPKIPPDIQKKSYADVLSMIRQNSKAKIVLVTPVCNDPETTRKTAENYRKWTGTGYLFGKPEFAEAFVRTLKEIADTEKTGYLDLYTPTKNLSPKKPYFKEDGVHLTELGNGKVAELVLAWLAENWK